MKWSLLKAGSLRLMVCKPHWEAYGHLALEIAMMLRRARQERAAVHFIRPRATVNRALTEVMSDAVRILPPAAWRSALLAVPWSIYLTREWFLGPKGTVAHWGKKIRKRFGWKPAPKGGMGPYYLRRLLREPLTVHLPPALQEEAARAAERIGVAPGAPVVTLHAREAGFKASDVAFKGQMRNDDARNVRIESYFEAVDHLKSAGYTVVRIGDPSMAPLRRDDVIDLARSPERTDLLELYLLIRSRLLLGCASGPAWVTLLTDTPTVLTNATDPIECYPVPRHHLYILKHPVERATGRALSLEDMLTAGYYANLRNLEKYEYRDNSPGEILQAVRELLDRLNGEPAESPEQQGYRRRVLQASEELRDLAFIRKWGADEGFIGDGVIGHDFARTRLGSDPPPRA